MANVGQFLALLPQGGVYDRWRRMIRQSKTLQELIRSGLLTPEELVGREHSTGFQGALTDGAIAPGSGGPGGGAKYLEQMLAEAEVTPEPEVSSRQYNPRRFGTMDVHDLFEDLRRQPVPQLAPGASVYRRPQMAEEGVPANAERA